MVCNQGTQKAGTPGIWNPLPYFTTVRQDHQLGNIQSLKDFYTAAQNGTLPAVSWIDPSNTVSEHPPALVSAGQSYVTKLINAIMGSPDWSSTAIFVSWDDWGGFYDHVVPPAVDKNGYGLRVPGLVISPYAKRGYIDHSALSFDSYNKFIEDDFLGGARLNSKDGRPDPRPDVRENQAGSLLQDLNFGQRRRKLLLPTCPKTDLVPSPGPTAKISGPSSIAHGTSGTWTAITTDPCQDAKVSSYSWNWGDGTTTITTGSAPRTYSTAASYTITLTVKDNYGVTGTATYAVSVS